TEPARSVQLDAHELRDRGQHVGGEGRVGRQMGSCATLARAGRGLALPRSRGGGIAFDVLIGPVPGFVRGLAEFLGPGARRVLLDISGLETENDAAAADGAGWIA